MNWTQGTLSGLSGTAGKRYVLYRVLADGASAQEMAKKVEANSIPGVVILDSDGKALAKLGYSLPAQEGSKAIAGTPDHLAGLEALEKAKGPAAVAAALKKVAALPCKKAAEVLTEHAKDEKAPESVRRAAIEGLARQPEAAKELVSFLTHKSQPYRSAASAALKSLGILAVPALLDALESGAADERAAAYQVAQAITKNPKVSRDAFLWKDGKEDARKKALDGWREWYEKTKPQPPKS